MPTSDSPSPATRDALAAIVERCVLAFEQDGDAGIAAVLAGEPELATAAAAQLEALRSSGLLPPPDADPEHIGPYRILQRLGRGGMGTVYLAEQQAPLQRRVALKVIKKGMDTREVLARFSIERQALALLDHPGVARALDAGSTDDGRPYLCMEYVAGQPITAYCDERGLDLRQRIELLAQVCDAVQAAHQKGILHRDLKPSNILIADRDGAPRPVVIDFGMAKSLGGRLADVSLHTATGQVVGTPEYMSPDQAMNCLDVDTRTDVYSLGVVLYQLLTGVLPFDSPRLRSSQDELLRTLRQEAPTPSTRITRLGRSASELARTRRTDPQSLRRHLRGELDWVVMKALEKDRNRRYGMAAELAADLRRHLHGEAVLAAPPSAAYRWRKLIGRHRLQFGAAAAVFVALGAGLAVSLAFHREAEAKALAAEQSLDIALQAVQRMVQAGADRLGVVPRMDEVRRQLLEEALELHQRLASATGSGRLQLRTADALAELAQVQAQLGDVRAAVASMRQAQALLASLPAAERGTAAAGRLAAEAGFRLAQWGEDLGEPTAAVAGRRQAALAQVEQLLAAGEPDAATRQLAVRVLTQVAMDRRGSDAAAAGELFARVQALAAPVLRAPMAQLAELPGMLTAAAQHASFLVESGQPEAAKQRSAEIRAVIDRVFAATADPLQRARFLPVLTGIEQVRYRTEQYRDLIADLDLVVELRRQLAHDFPAVEAHAYGLGVALVERGLAAERLGNLDQAIADVTAAQATFEPLQQEHPESANYRLRLLQCAIAVADVTARRANLGGKVDWPQCERSLQVCRTCIDGAGDELQGQPRFQELVGEFHRTSGNVALGRGDLPGSVAAHRQSVAAFEQLVRQYPDRVSLQGRLVDVQENLARSLLQQGQPDAAAPLIEAAVQRHQQVSAKLGDREHQLATTRELLELELRVAIARRRFADFDAGLDRLLACTLIPDRDSIGHDTAARLSLDAARAAGDDAALRGRLLGRLRREVDAALACAAQFASFGSMQAVQQANSLRLLVQGEQLASDFAAAAAAQQRVVDGYLRPWQERPNERNQKRLAAALQLWCELALQAGDPPQAERAAAAAAAAFPQQPEQLAAAALSFGAAALALPPGEAADACAERGRKALAAAVAAGFRDDGSLAKDPRAAPIRRLAAPGDR